MWGEIILENGDRARFYLKDDAIQKLEHEVKKQNEYYREHDKPKNYNMAEELWYGMCKHLKHLPDPAQTNETPGAATPRESE